MASLAVGDFVVYPAQGVGRVTALEERHVGGHLREFFLVEVLDADAAVLIPTEAVERSGVRRIIDSSQAETVLAVFDRPAAIHDGVSWIRRSRGYEQSLSAGGARDIAHVLRDLYVMKMVGRLSFGQLRLFERSRRMVVRELAIALDRAPERVEADILARVRACN